MLPRPPALTRANWREAAHTPWAFQHLREILPTAAVDEDPARRWPLPRALRDLGGLTIEASLTLDQWLEESQADGLIVLHRGTIVLERYRRGLTPAQPHMIFSITKSLLALLIGVLAERGLLDPEAPVTRYLPEVTGAYAATTLRHSLDMLVSLDFDETESDPDGSVRRYWEAVGWTPPRARPQPLDLRGYLATVGPGPAPHGDTVRYITANTDLLGWVCERVTGQPLARLLSEHIWQPLGAERPGSLGLDHLGAANPGGGFSCTLRDLARVGELVRCRGLANGRQIVPAWWIDDILTGGDPAAWARCSFAEMLPPGTRYRSQWYVNGTTALGIGGYCQWLWVERRHDIVIAKLSSRPTAQVQGQHRLELAAFAALAGALAAV